MRPPSSPSPVRPPVHAAGFTLIELMIVVAVIGILAGIAYPSYRDHIRRSRITEATNQLSTYRVQLEQYYQDHRNYGSDADSCGDGIGSADGEAFTFSCSWGSGATAQEFLLSASGKEAQGMEGYTYTLDQDNLRRTTAYPGASGLPKDCWLLRAGDSC